MLRIKVNEHKEKEVEISGDEIILNGKKISADIVKISDGKYHIIHNNASYTAELLTKEESGKQMTISINGKKQNVTITDEFDILLHKLGMDKVAGTKINEVKAPMPGLVLKIMITEGQSVKKGDPLLVLEAMKMENIIKSTGEGIVKKILAQPKQAVEKNQVLLVME